MKKKTLLSWSSGKDSAWALHLLQQDPTIDLAGLFTAVNQKDNRVSMHATRLEMLQHQAEAVGLPVQMINLPDPCTNEQYEYIMGQFIMASAAKGVEVMAFGDLYLKDVRKYREDRMKGTGVEMSFPLWGIPTRQLAEHMLSAGLEAYISSVDLKKVPAHFAGQKWSRELIAEFPQGSDACGENGEIHTVAVGGPMFQKPIPVSVGEVFEQNGFAYADIIPC
ncbi:MAG: ATP-binding protein [Deltaproteobacteria bacterium]|nr:ATP-binding protein [Deltaproteobacteria bacterium]MBW2094491.1 ATP-binding protein [Deltaproteobacteria bacterium]